MTLRTRTTVDSAARKISFQLRRILDLRIRENLQSRKSDVKWHVPLVGTNREQL